MKVAAYAVASLELSAEAGGVGAGFLAAGRERLGVAGLATGLAVGLVAADVLGLAAGAAGRLAVLRERAGRAVAGVAAGAGPSEVVEMLSEAAGVPFS